jgi:hypothetical protein
VVLALVAALASLAGPAGPVTADAAATGVPKTTIMLKVRGCERCSVQPIQNLEGGVLTYVGRRKPVHNGTVTLVVPTARTERMAFRVYAPFDQIAKHGFALVAVTAYKAMEPGEKVTATYAAGAHIASACWVGTTLPAVKNTLVVRHTRAYDWITGHRVTVASAYLRKTMESQPIWRRVRGASIHLEDPSICE